MKLGRPKKARTRGRYLQVRLEEQEKQAFDKAASLAGLDLSAWVRERLRTAARKELREMGKAVPFSDVK